MSKERIPPYVRYLILCQDVIPESDGRTVSLIRLFTRMHAKAGEAFPLRRRRVCVYVQASGCRGNRSFGIAIREMATGQLLNTPTMRQVEANEDPLTIVQMKFELRDLTFQAEGAYAFELWCDGEHLAEQTLQVGPER